MVKLNDIIGLLVVDRDLILQFFALFSRFEYSLKRTGCLKPSDKAEPNWDMYANSVRGQFAAVQDNAFQNAITLLLKEPPKTQIAIGNDLDWIETVPGNGEFHERYVLRLVSTVRNNLFHGGKFSTRPVTDEGRNRDLLEAAMVVLKRCLELSRSVRAAFEETA